LVLPNDVVLVLLCFNKFKEYVLQMIYLQYFCVVLLCLSCVYY